MPPRTGEQCTPGNCCINALTFCCMHFPCGNDFVGAREGVTVGVRPHPGGSLLAAKVKIYKDNQFVVSPW